MDISIYNKYVNREKNDFSNWIMNVFGDKLLAALMTNTMTKDEIRVLVRTRIEQLERIASN